MCASPERPWFTNLVYDIDCFLLAYMNYVIKGLITNVHIFYIIHMYECFIDQLYIIYI